MKKFNISSFSFIRNPLPPKTFIWALNHLCIKALVDGGASRSFMGHEGFELINKLGFKINHKHRLV